MVPSSNRFHGLASLRFVHSKGKVVRGQYFALKYALNQKRQLFRIAVVVSKKVNKKAVIRNQIRRKLYECIRLQAQLINQPYDIVLMVYSDEVANIPYKQLENQVTNQLKKANII